jgi:hypothetical protein
LVWVSALRQFTRMQHQPIMSQAGTTETAHVNAVTWSVNVRDACCAGTVVDIGLGQPDLTQICHARGL